MKSYVKFLRLFYKRSIGSVLLFQLFGFVIGVAVVIIANAIDPGTFSELFGGISAAVAAMVFSVFSGNFSASYFLLSVSMGERRRDYIAYEFIFTLLTACAAAVLIPTYFMIESTLYTGLYPGFESIALERIVSIPLYAFCILSVVLLKMFCMMFCARFGVKGYLAMFVTVIAVINIIPQAMQAVEDGKEGILAGIGTGLISFASGLPSWGAGALLFLAAALLCAIGILGMLKCEVRNV